MKLIFAFETLLLLAFSSSKPLGVVAAHTSGERDNDESVVSSSLRGGGTIVVLHNEKNRALNQEKKYTVVFKKEAGIADPKGKALGLIDPKDHAKGLSKLKKAYEHSIRGFTASLSMEEVAEISKNPDVAYVEEETEVLASAFEPWGIDRIDQKNLPLDETYTSPYDGSGVHVFIIDTGIRTTHTDYASRVATNSANHYDAVDDDNDPTDCHGHGTHVASTAVGTTYGVAKGAKLHGVRVLNCNGSGTSSNVIDGIEFVAARCTAKKWNCVANLSLGGTYNQAINDAVDSLANSGVVVVVAAGNDNDDACNYSPASAGRALSIASTTSSDARSSFSNYGTCVDMFAPGSSIKAAWKSGDSATRTKSGTSMAAPHVTGAAALFLQMCPTNSVTSIQKTLISFAANNKVTSAGSGSPNRMVHIPAAGDSCIYSG